MIEQDDQNKKKGNGAYEPGNSDSDNEYGLPEAEYSPIQREQPQTFEEHVTTERIPQNEDEQPRQKNSSTPMWIALGVILLLAGFFVYFFAFDEPTRSEQVTSRPETKTETTIIEEEPPVAETPAEEEWTEPEVVEGSVSSISSRTGRYYMIVGSFVDGDLANDYAKNLAGEGHQAKIIEPAGTRKFYRLSVKDAGSIADLNTELEAMRAKYGENVWIVKY
jgi:cell division protein FtsN